MPEPTAQILEGRRPLEDIRGVELRQDATWDEEQKRWFLELEIEADVEGGSAEVPPKTRWFVHVSPNYPQGDIDVLPAAEGGLTQTFQHQRNNSTVGLKKEVAERRWRPGKICIDTGTAALDRHGADPAEPRSAAARLEWHVERTKLWIQAAATGSLTKPGDPFELPDYRSISGSLILFHEGDASLASWSATQHKWGWVNFASVNAGTRATTTFRSPSGREIYGPPWGEAVANVDASEVGLWLRLEKPLASEPWQAPMTWGAIEDCFEKQEASPLALIEKHADRIRDGRSHLMLIGYPIPAIIGGPAVRMHWVALRLPVLTGSGARIKGFRNTGQGLWSYDRTRLFRPDSPALWESTENADDSELTSRGSLSPNWREARVLVIGCGALGSAVAELLARGGVRDLILCDPDNFESGNLVRHTLTCDNLGENKAEALATRLNSASPNANAQAIPETFPPTKTADVERATRATVVVDCSANDSVLHSLAAFPFENLPATFHISFGSHAARLFLYGRSPGPAAPEKYLDWIDPWLAKERGEATSEAEIRPSAGCWHPAFPARADHVWLLAAATMTWMNEQLEEGRFESWLVLKRTDAFELLRVSLDDG